MAQHGGYRKPARPAPVSGPGRLSRRTDGGPAQNVTRLPNAGYGESRDFEQIQNGAPMEAATPIPSVGSVPTPTPGAGGIGDLAALLGGGPSVPPPTPLTNDSQRPAEPVTSGAPAGPGPGPSPEVIGPANRVSDLLARIMNNDLTGEVADLYNNAVRRGL